MSLQLNKLAMESLSSRVKREVRNIMERLASTIRSGEPDRSTADSPDVAMPCYVDPSDPADTRVTWEPMDLDSGKIAVYYETFISREDIDPAVCIALKHKNVIVRNEMPDSYVGYVSVISTRDLVGSDGPNLDEEVRARARAPRAARASSQARLTVAPAPPPAIREYKTTNTEEIIDCFSLAPIRIRKGSWVVELPCGHKYSRTSYNLLVERHTHTCPMCRAPMP
jgi:hypothetical protein